MELLHVLVTMCPEYPRDTGCSVVRVSLLHESTQESRALCGCSRSWVSPLKEDGASACPGDPGCSVSRVSLNMNLSCSKAPGTMFIDPTGYKRAFSDILSDAEDSEVVYTC